MRTARANRISGCRLHSDAEMNGNGSHVERQATIEGVEVIVKWYDSRGVNIASTFGSAEPLASYQRYDCKKKERCEVQQPAIVKTYNPFTGGVDLLDGLISHYRIFITLKKFYPRFCVYILRYGCCEQLAALSQAPTTGAGASFLSALIPPVVLATKPFSTAGIAML